MSVAEELPATVLEAYLQGIMSDVTNLRRELREAIPEIEPDDISAFRVIERFVEQMTREAETLYQSQQRETKNVF
mgnify:CR=1 FL=1